MTKPLTKEQLNNIDKTIGSQLRARRHVLKMSQDDLARSAGITFQQVQKYEHGTNRISASRMVQFGQILDVPPSYFFGELAKGDPRSNEIGLSAEAVDVAKIFDRTSDPDARRLIKRAISGFGHTAPKAHKAGQGRKKAA